MKTCVWPRPYSIQSALCSLGTPSFVVSNHPNNAPPEFLEIHFFSASSFNVFMYVGFTAYFTDVYLGRKKNLKSVYQSFLSV